MFLRKNVYENSMKKLDEFCRKYADYLIWVFISAYILVFGYLCFLKYTSFSYFDWDLASDAVVLWNSVHGKLLYYPFLEQTIFGAHLYLIIFLILPIYALFQHPLTLLLLQSIFLGLAAFPLYLLARTKLNKTFSLSIAAAYLLYPSLGYINLFETHFEIYEIFFLFFALYYFEKENFKKFSVFILLTLLCKENASLAVSILGIYALIRRRSKKWILVPLLAGAVWFLVSVKLVIPYFAGDAKKLYQDGFMFSIYYKHLGNNLFEMAETVILHPVQTASYALTPNKMLYIFQLLLPVGFLGLLSPWALVPTIPILMQNLLSSVGTHSLIHYQYVAILIPFIFFSTIKAFDKLLRHKYFIEHQAALLCCFFGFVIFSGAYLQAPQLNLNRYFSQYRAGDYSKEKEKLIKKVPRTSSVITTFQFLPKLANRHDLYSLHLVSLGYKMYTKTKYEPPKNIEYALIDFNEPLMINSFFPPSAPENIRSFLETDDWKVFKAFDDVVLFKKGYKEGPRLCEAVQDPKIEHVMNVDLGKEIVFLGYDVVDDNMSDSRILHLVYYWKRIKEGNKKPLGFFIQFSDANGKIRFQKKHVFGYRVYLQEEWKERQIIKEHHYILMPSDAEKGNYGISFTFFVLKEDLN